MSAPKRIQLRRTKGWRKPEGAILVSRPSKFGNPFEVWFNRGWWAESYDPKGKHRMLAVLCKSKDDARAVATEAYRMAFLNQWWLMPTVDQVLALAGHDLACWCPLDGQPCHADVLLELANR